MGEKLWAVLGYVIGGIWLLALLEVLLVQSQDAMVPYCDFKTLLAAGKVTEATVGRDTIDAARRCFAASSTWLAVGPRCCRRITSLPAAE